MYLTTPLMGFPTRTSKMCDHICIRLETIPAYRTDKRTDRRTELVQQYRALHVVNQ